MENVIWFEISLATEYRTLNSPVCVVNWALKVYWQCIWEVLTVSFGPQNILRQSSYYNKIIIIKKQQQLDLFTL